MKIILKEDIANLGYEDDVVAKMEKCCFLFAKNDYLIGITSIFSLK